MTCIATAPVSRRGNTLVVRRAYQYDTLGRPTSRTLARQGATRNDAFTYNDRSELISDVVDGTGLNGWDYDRAAAASSSGVASNKKAYANQLNQYTAIEDESHDVFTPTYDDDGNQTRIKTSTGIWNVTYNAKNRPVLFSKEGENLTVACTYDYMGRRATKVVTENGVVTTSHRFLYRGYLQIACCDRKRANHPCLWLITWDPTQPIATRPLAIQKDGTWYSAPARLASQGSRSQVCSRLGGWLLKPHPAYGWDLTKNVWEVYGTTGYIRTNYSYSPYGEVAISGDVTQPIQWSSELNDAELGLVYYNYRHYNPVEGRWMGREPLTESIIKPRYVYIRNNPTTSIDIIGLENCPEIPLPTPNQPSQCKPIVYIFIGGERDSKYGPMYDCMLRSLGYCTGVCKTNGTKKCGCQVGPILSDGISVYYHWTSRDAILKDIRGYKRVCPHSRIVLLGHSYGGDTAMDVSERLENITNITLVTLDPVSDFDSYNWSNKRPSNIDYWINAYVGKGVFDLFSPVYGAGQAVSFVGTFLTTFSISNSIASGGGKWGYENAADVNIPFPLYGSIRHGDAYELLAPSTGERPIDYLNEFLFPKIQ